MTEPALYKHRPTVVRAEHYAYDNLPAVKAFLEQRIPGSYQFSADDSALSIDTHEGERAVCIEENYMIVEGLPCDVYPVRKDRFDRLYELAVESASAPPSLCLAADRVDAEPDYVRYVCTLLCGHIGDHEAQGPARADGSTPVYKTWSQGGA